MTQPTDKEMLERIKKQREKEAEAAHAIVMKDKGITGMKQAKK